MSGTNLTVMTLMRAEIVGFPCHVSSKFHMWARIFSVDVLQKAWNAHASILSGCPIAPSPTSHAQALLLLTYFISLHIPILERTHFPICSRPFECMLRELHLSIAGFPHLVLFT
jgi:hypothetical protein